MNWSVEFANLSARVHALHADGGRRFTLMVEGTQRMRVTGIFASQVSAMDVRPPALPVPMSNFRVGNPASKAMRC